MCGICGELQLNNTRAELDHIRKMLNTLEPRGPDSEGSYSDGPLAFGHRRLSIIDLSFKANQPMLDSQLSLALVFNGTIYNYRELRDKLVSDGYQFFSSGDTEVILKSYDKWGKDCVKHFQGMFAFAIWDIKKQSLFLARDRMGIKPLYFMQKQGVFRFASNIQALLSVGDVSSDIDNIALHHQLTLHAVIPAPRTILKQVRKLPPACTMTIDQQGNSQIEQYWNLYDLPVIENRSEDEWLMSIHNCLRQAVRKRLEASDVPVGVLLSGGLDSSLLVALLAEQGVENLHTFSVGFEDQPEEKGNEFYYSDQVVKRFATDHHRYVVKNSEVLKVLPNCIKSMAEPMVGQDAVAFYLLSQQVSKEIKVVQSGQGADEVFAGYFWYPLMEQYPGSDLDRFASHYFDRDHNEWLETVHPQYHTEDQTSKWFMQEFAKYNNEIEYVNRVLRLDVSHLIVDDPVKRVDNMTMAWGLEARVPFLDHQLVELAAQIPAKYKIEDKGKYLLKKLGRDLLPREVVDRPKGYFPMPALKYVRGEFLQFMQEILSNQAARQRGLFNPHYIEKLFAKPEDYLTRLQGSKLWHCALLEAWLQTHVDPH